METDADFDYGSAGGVTWTVSWRPGEEFAAYAEAKQATSLRCAAVVHGGLEATMRIQIGGRPGLLIVDPPGRWHHGERDVHDVR